MSDTNWRELSAGPELDRIVAKRLGRRIVRETDFLDSKLYATTPSHIYFPEVPLYSRDAAAPLPLAEGDRIVMIERHDGTFSAQVQPYLDGDFYEQNWPAMTAPTLALARLRAWLAHDDVKRTANETKGDVQR